MGSRYGDRPNQTPNPKPTPSPDHNRDQTGTETGEKCGCAAFESGEKKPPTMLSADHYFECGPRPWANYLYNLPLNILATASDCKIYCKNPLSVTLLSTYKHNRRDCLAMRSIFVMRTIWSTIVWSTASDTAALARNSAFSYILVFYRLNLGWSTCCFFERRRIRCCCKLRISSNYKRLITSHIILQQSVVQAILWLTEYML